MRYFFISEIFNCFYDAEKMQDFISFSTEFKNSYKNTKLKILRFCRTSDPWGNPVFLWRIHLWLELWKVWAESNSWRARPTDLLSNFDLIHIFPKSFSTIDILGPNENVACILNTWGGDIDGKTTVDKCWDIRRKFCRQSDWTLDQRQPESLQVKAHLGLIREFIISLKFNKKNYTFTFW